MINEFIFTRCSSRCVQTVRSSVQRRKTRPFYHWQPSIICWLRGISGISAVGNKIVISFHCAIGTLTLINSLLATLSHITILCSANRYDLFSPSNFQRTNDSSQRGDVCDAGSRTGFWNRSRPIELKLQNQLSHQTPYKQAVQSTTYSPT